MAYILYFTGFASDTVDQIGVLQLIFYLKVYLTDVFVQVKVYHRSGQKMHLELVHLLLEGLEAKSKKWKCLERGPLGWRAAAGDESVCEEISNGSLFGAGVGSWHVWECGVCRLNKGVTGFQSAVRPNQKVFQVLGSFVG